jgi:hypothetical protein
MILTTVDQVPVGYVLPMPIRENIIRPWRRMSDAEFDKITRYKSELLEEGYIPFMDVGDDSYNGDLWLCEPHKQVTIQDEIQDWLDR